MTLEKIVEGFKEAGYRVAILQAADQDVKRFMAAKPHPDIQGGLEIQITFDMTGIDLFVVDGMTFKDWLDRKMGLGAEQSKIITL